MIVWLKKSSRTIRVETESEGVLKDMIPRGWSRGLFI